MLNKVILMGRLTADIELKHTGSGIATASFSIAVERNFTEKDSDKRKADFINIVAWRQTALFIEKHFKKGALLAIEGSIQTRNYEDKQSNKRTAFEVVADQVYFTGSKPKAVSSADGEQSEPFNPDDYQDVESNEDLPF